MTSGRKLSSTTSDLAISSLVRRIPVSSFRLISALRTFRLDSMNLGARSRSSPAPKKRKLSSPPWCDSILITSAPHAASTRAAFGPATLVVDLTALMPFRKPTSNHPLGEKDFDVASREAQALGENLARVLAEERGAGHRLASAVQDGREGHLRVGAEVGVFGRLEELAGLDVLVGHEAGGSVDRQARDPGPLELVGQVVAAIAAGELLDRLVDLGLVLVAEVVVQPLVVAETLRVVLPEVHEALPVGAGHKQVDVAVGGREDVGGRDVLVLASVADDAVAIRGERADHVLLAGDRLLDGHVHSSALAVHVALVEGEQRPERGVDRGEIVGLRLRRVGRRKGGIAADGHQAAEGEAHDVGAEKVAVRAGLAEGRHGGHEQLGVPLAQDTLAQAQEEVAALGVADIEREALLAGVQVGEAEAALQVGDVVLERAGTADRISPRPLDLDDFEAEVVQQLAAHLPFEVREVEGEIAVEERHGSNVRR